MSILQKRLQQALDECASLTIETANESWLGIPLYLDNEWVELLAVQVTDGDQPEVKQQTWLIRLDRIEAIATPCQEWSADRLSKIPVLGKELPRE